MAKRYSGKPVLYEAIKKHQGKVSIFEKIKRARFVRKRSIKTEESKNPFDGFKAKEIVETDGVDDENWPPKSNKTADYLRLTAKRVFFSRIVRISVIVGLLLFAVFIVSSKLADGVIESSTANMTEERQQEYLDAHSEEPDGSMTEAERAEKEVLTKPMGDHVIVVVQYPNRRDLEPVKEYYRRHGIEMKIQRRGNSYFLLTENKFESPRRAGSDGYYAREKIRQLGKAYSAPRGFETFGSEPFQDAYGMKVR